VAHAREAEAEEGRGGLPGQEGVPGQGGLLGRVRVLEAELAGLVVKEGELDTAGEEALAAAEAAEARVKQAEADGLGRRRMDVEERSKLEAQALAARCECI